VADRPEITPGEWISIGEKSPRVKAVVCTIYNEPPFDCEVVYLDERNRAINEGVKWTGTYWDFAHQGASGGYADNYARLSRYIAILRGNMRLK
jgi:hypothetical protein